MQEMNFPTSNKQLSEIEDEECISLIGEEDDEGNSKGSDGGSNEDSDGDSSENNGGYSNETSDEGEFTIDLGEENTNDGNYNINPQPTTFQQSNPQQSISQQSTSQQSTLISEIQSIFSTTTSEIQGAFFDTETISPSPSSNSSPPTNTTPSPTSYYETLLSKITALDETDIRNFRFISTTELVGFVGILEYNYAKYIIFFTSEGQQYYSQLIEEFLGYKSLLLRNKQGVLTMLDIQKCLNLDNVNIFINLPFSEVQDILMDEGFLCLDGIYTKCLE